VNSEDKFDEQQADRQEGGNQVFEGLRVKPRALGGSGGMLPGLVLVVIGVVILLDHMGYIPAERIWRLWPVILIVVGAVKFFKECNRALGAVLMVIGAFFLSNNLGFTRLNWNDLWPLVLIAAGVALIWSRIEMPKLRQGSRSGPSGANSINEYAIFGGAERRINANNFTGGTITAIFGGVELDFRSADIEGEEAVVYVEAIFGGIEIVVPERWTVTYEGQSIFGGYSDETRPPLPDVPGAPPKKRLILRGRAVFGGINVKN
jgi:predicted membrane protein